VERLALAAEVRGLVEAGNYAEIVHQIDVDGRQGTRISSGVWRSTVKMASFSEVLTAKAKAEGDWAPLLAALRSQARQQPAVWLLYADALNAQAWAVRGGGFAHQVRPEAMARFREIGRASRDTLDRHRALLSAMPEWYVLRLRVALETGETEAVRRRLFVEGMLRFPRYLQLYLTRLRDLLPAWGGSQEEILDLFNQIARSSDPAIAEEGLYARLAWYAEQVRSGVLREPTLDGAAFDRAVDAVLDRYPTQRNLQRFFVMQCQRGNLPAMQRLLPRLKPPMSAELTSDPYTGLLTFQTFETCQFLAAGAFKEARIRYWMREREVEFLLQGAQERAPTP